jgi:hypothetical protein
MKKNSKKVLADLALPDEPRAIKTMRDFLNSGSSHVEEKAIEPLLENEVPEVMLSPAEYTSMCFCPVLTPLEILLEKEDYATNPDRVWDRVYEKYCAFMRNHKPSNEVC